MTVCLTYNGTLLKKGSLYRRKDIFELVQKSEYRASTYYDPDKGELFSFYKENDENFENIYKNNILLFKRRDGADPGQMAAWELQKKRHVFLHYGDRMKSGSFEYLGIAVGENKKIKNGIPCRELLIHL